jgi:hypothetical protein
VGLFDTLTDAFTGAPAKKAAAEARNYLTGVQSAGNQNIATGFNTATDAVRSGTTDALAALLRGYTGGTGAINTGADQGRDYLNSGVEGARGVLAQTLSGANAAYNPMDVLAGKYGRATSLGINALGVNGAGNAAAARSAFEASPGYSFNLDQGLEAINRRRNAGGMLASGNADRDAQTYGAGLASQEYDKWLANLLGFANPEFSATSGAAAGRAGAAQNVGLADANLVNSAGINQAGLATSRAAMLADLASRYGQNTAGVAQGQGNALAGLATGQAGQQIGLSTALASPYAQTFSNEAAAQMQGSSNLWGLGLGLANVGAGIYGKKTGGDAIAKLLGM